MPRSSSLWWPRAVAAAGDDLPPELDIDPEVIARPVEAETENVAPTDPSVLNFYGPAVLALVIQHLGVSLTSLTLVRERRGGHMDRYRVAPVSASEILIGKALAYGLVTVAVAAGVAALLVYGLGVPVASGWVGPALVVLLLALASLGLGLVISLVADTEQQAVQLSMLLLLASAFLSGLVLPISSFATWMEPIAYLLPVTHGIAALQETMLRGSLTDLWMARGVGGHGPRLLRRRGVAAAARAAERRLSHCGCKVGPARIRPWAMKIVPSRSTTPGAGRSVRGRTRTSTPRGSTSATTPAARLPSSPSRGPRLSALAGTPPVGDPLPVRDQPRARVGRPARQRLGALSAASVDARRRIGHDNEPLDGRLAQLVRALA